MFQKVFRQHAALLKALANPKRLEVVHLLKQGRLTVSDMERMLGIRQANLSQHLMVLRRLGVVAADHEGKERRYYLAHNNFARASDLLRSVLIERLGGRAAKASQQLKVVTDPVCGMRLTPASAASSVNQGQTDYYFCGRGCANEFKRKKYD